MYFESNYKSMNTDQLCDEIERLYNCGYDKDKADKLKFLVNELKIKSSNTVGILET